jgi:DNA replication initiation complex subunit (GINS family)
MAHLEQGFYPKLRRYLSALKIEAARAPEKILELEKTRQLTKDIVNSRLRKVVSVASAPTQTEQILKSFTPEERQLYLRLCRLIGEWRNHIVEERELEE